MNYMKKSRQLSYLLRHCQDPLYISLNGGWAYIDVILEKVGVSREELDEIVATDEKTRYAYSADGTRIRANQGHSIAGVLIDMEAPEPPEYLYHGTATRFLDSIMNEGLKPMERQWVHISSDYKTAVTVGKRHGEPVVLRFRAKDYVRDGYQLFRSANGVWQAPFVPVIYLELSNNKKKI